ncbi:MarR family winged helix-turn-helix transcriptional regulator [Streptomyces liangshanensis]|uniref:MarR family winged helix-turn-helix transcriptional regulator n=1 Tax=Streptomyces liangshanensis TaxID=2717324 RepID=UPI0036DEA1A9
MPTDLPDTPSDGSSAEEPRWLDADERETWLALSCVITRLPGALDSQLQRDAGLSFFGYMVLAVLAEHPERTLQMSDLAFLANGSLSRVSHIVKRLENQGFLRREPHPDDGRLTNAILTGVGYDKVVAAAPGHVAHVRALVLDALSPEERAQLARISRSIEENIASDGK